MPFITPSDENSPVTLTEVVLWCVLGVFVAFLTLVAVGVRRMPGDILGLVALLMATASRRPDLRWARMMFVVVMPFVVCFLLYLGWRLGLIHEM